jgi:hypothetical protein
VAVNVVVVKIQEFLIEGVGGFSFHRGLLHRGRGWEALPGSGWNVALKVNGWNDVLSDGSSSG